MNCRCHCRCCGSCFSSLEAFDAHHEGSGEGLRPCTFPVDLLESTGICRIAGAETKPAVTLYSSARSTEVAERLRKPSDSPARAHITAERGAG